MPKIVRSKIDDEILREKRIVDFEVSAKEKRT